jgi:hypothetical protein
MKTLYPTQSKKSFTYQALALVITLWLIQPGARAQTAASWSFTNTLAATPGAHLSAPNITLGTSVVSNAFNAGTEFFGQDGWPSGALDANAYLQFTVNANAGYFAVLNTIALTIRHSSLGTAAGSGPASWSLRSSLDGYSSDISGGNSLTNSYQTFTIPLPAAFQSIASTVTFRIYGYNQTTTAGGLNRFVFDNISVAGQAVSGVLAAQSIDLTAKALTTTSNGISAANGTAVATGATVDLQWQTIGFPAGTNFILERSANGTDFTAIDQQMIAASDVSVYRYEDVSLPAGSTLFYRIQANEPGGNTVRSSIVAVSIQEALVKGAAIRGVVTQGTSIKTLLHIQDAGSYQVSVWSRDGKALHRQMVSGQTGDVALDISFGANPHGIYILTLTKEGVNSSRQFMF